MRDSTKLVFALFFTYFAGTLSGFALFGIPWLKSAWGFWAWLTLGIVIITVFSYLNEKNLRI
jgi:hypothetical protein